MRRHYNYCLQWLPSCLGADAYVIWKRCKNKNDWIELKKELLQEYDDPTIRVAWKSDLKAYLWDESKESLNTFCAKVKRYVDTYDTEIAEVPAARNANYFIRFTNGLPNDYLKQVKMGTSSKKQTIERALDICLRYQQVKKEGNCTKLEIAASVNF